MYGRFSSFSICDGVKLTESCINKELLATTDLICTTTGNVDVCDKLMLANVKSGAVICNIGHFDNEIDTQFLREKYDWEEVKYSSRQSIQKQS